MSQVIDPERSTRRLLHYCVVVNMYLVLLSFRVIFPACGQKQGFYRKHFISIIWIHCTFNKFLRFFSLIMIKRIIPYRCMQFAIKLASIVRAAVSRFRQTDSALIISYRIFLGVILLYYIIEITVRKLQYIIARA